MRDSLGRGYDIHGYNDCGVDRSAIKHSGGDTERVGSRRTPGANHDWIKIAPHASKNIFGPRGHCVTISIIDQMTKASGKHKGATVSSFLKVDRERVQNFAGNICRKISLP